MVTYSEYVMYDSKQGNQGGDSDRATKDIGLFMKMKSQKSNLLLFPKPLLFRENLPLTRLPSWLDGTCIFFKTEIRAGLDREKTGIFKAPRKVRFYYFTSTTFTIFGYF